jgi:hypothetical protein
MFGKSFARQDDLAERKQELVERNAALDYAMQYMRTINPKGTYSPEEVVRVAFTFAAFLRHGMLTTFGPVFSETIDGQAESAS